MEHIGRGVATLGIWGGIWWFWWLLFFLILSITLSLLAVVIIERKKSHYVAALFMILSVLTGILSLIAAGKSSEGNPIEDIRVWGIAIFLAWNWISYFYVVGRISHTVWAFMSIIVFLFSMVVFGITISHPSL